jgi:hypothetical protein
MVFPFKKKREQKSEHTVTIYSDVLTNAGDDPYGVMEIYSHKLNSLFEGLSIISDTSSRKSFKNDKSNVSIWIHDRTIGIEIEGANTGYWNTSEEEDLDIYFWFAVGALRNGIRYRKPLIGLEQAWIYSEENRAWAVVPKNIQSYYFFDLKEKYPD